MNQTAALTPADVGDLFAAEGLPAPPVPAALAGTLRHWDDWVFATVEPESNPWGVETYVAAALADPAPRVLIAHAGYGINSAAIHYFLEWEGLALFLQVPWGGAYTDDEAAVTTLAARFAQIRSLLERPPGASGERLFVLDTVGQRVWARVPEGDPAAAVSWRRSRDPFAEALASVLR